MQFRFASLALFIALLGTLVVAPLHTEAQSTTAIPVEVSGTGEGSAFAGTFLLDQIVSQDGGLLAVGTLTGVLTDVLGNVVGTVSGVPVGLPVAGVDATCDILHLNLAGLDLDVLGLVVHLNPTMLDADAVPAEGGLLGNLLCPVSHLLDGAAGGNVPADLLNQILGLLG